MHVWDKTNHDNWKFGRHYAVIIIIITGHGPFSHLFEKDVMKNKEVKKILEKDNLKFPHVREYFIMQIPAWLL